MKKYICLVSDGKKISASNILPHGVTVEGDRWMFRSFSHRLGQAVTVYTDGVWVGPIAVYDGDSPDFAASVTRDTFQHAQALVSRRMQVRAGVILGDKAVQQLWDCWYASPSHPAPKFTRKGKIFWNLVDSLNALCFRGE